VVEVLAVVHPLLNGVDVQIRPLITAHRPFDMKCQPTVAGAVYFPCKSTCPHYERLRATHDDGTRFPERHC
jgi:hypothetical protein